jgi:N-carbamoyl-L-amino-acid hydrolase
VAARVTAFVRALTEEIGAPMVGTVGRINLHPDLINVVPATATMTVDLRHTDDAAIVAAEERLRVFVADAADEEAVGAAWQRLARFEPVDFDDTVVDRVEAAAAHRGLSHMRMPSGAGHDAQMVARICPTGMVFVPSRDGISHNPREHTDPEHLEAGTSVLLDVLVELAE